jgi:hypothetical protein
MPREDATAESDTGNRVSCEIVQSPSDPNRPWQLIVRNALGTEISRVGFKSYGEAWQEAQRQESLGDECQADLLAALERRQGLRPSEYKTDILTWSERQAGLLRQIAAGEKASDQIDWENVVEEVESAGRRQLAQLKSLLIQALANLLKVRAWPLSSEAGRWQTEALGLQSDAADIIDQRMRNRLDINDFYFKAIRRLPKTIDGQQPPVFPTECPVTLDDLLKD